VPAPFISVVTTLYRSEAYVREFYERTLKSLRAIGTSNYEFVIVNDGSPDRSVDIAIELARNDPSVKVVDLSRNFGHHKALMTGLQHATGDYIFLIDIDLEEPPELVEQFYPELENSGADVVFGVQKRRKGGWFERWSGRLFYTVVNSLSDYKLPNDLIVARLMKRSYVDSLLNHKEREIAIAGLWAYTGFKQLAIPVEKLSRAGSTYNIGRKINLTILSITSFSQKPLVYIAYLGGLILLFSFLYIAYLLFHFFSTGQVPEGYTSLIVSIWCVGGMVLFCLGVVAMYLSVIFLEVKQRPLTVVRRVYQQTTTNSLEDA
jgi:putative glycosyltransferase